MAFGNFIFALALSLAATSTAFAQSDTPQAPAAGTRVEVESAGSISADAYNEALSKKGGYCEQRACDAAPALLSAQAPVYPPGALRAGVEGRAAVTFDIDEQGVPRNVAVESATEEVFGEAALDAVRSWRFRPAMLDGRPVTFLRAKQVFPFELRD